MGWLQGNRVKESACDDEARKEVVIPTGGLTLESQRSLPRRLADEIVSDMLDGAKIGWSVIGSHPAFVVAEDHVHHPMQAVLDCPVATDDRPQKTCQQDQGGDVE